MADSGATGMHESKSSSDAPHHLDTNIESGQFDEKTSHVNDPAVSKKPIEDEEDDEDMDALIDELESQDGHAEEDEGEETATPGGGRVVPEDQLQTDTRVGLTDDEVHARRKKYGMNQMKEEKENLILKFLGYFIGPIQFVMEVCHFAIYL
jgi:H+-transporting ATPase